MTFFQTKQKKRYDRFKCFLTYVRGTLFKLLISILRDLVSRTNKIWIGAWIEAIQLPANYFKFRKENYYRCSIVRNIIKELSDMTLTWWYGTSIQVNWKKSLVQLPSFEFNAMRLERADLQIEFKLNVTRRCVCVCITRLQEYPLREEDNKIFYFEEIANFFFFFVLSQISDAETKRGKRGVQLTRCKDKSWTSFDSFIPPPSSYLKIFKDLLFGPFEEGERGVFVLPHCDLWAITTADPSSPPPLPLLSFSLSAKERDSSRRSPDSPAEARRRFRVIHYGVIV